MGKKTPLYDKHVQANARLVNFAGWDMPLHYGSQIDEHRYVRQDAGVFDVSHMTIIDLSGKRTFEFLRYLLANDVSRLKEIGKALYTCMLNERGGVIDDLIVYFLAEDKYRLIVNAGTHDKDLAWIQRHAKPFGVQLKERIDLAMLAVQGKTARRKIQNLLPADIKEAAEHLKPFYATWNAEEWFIARTGYTGEDGVEIIVPAKIVGQLWDKILATGVKPCGLGARDTLRLEAGMNLYGNDMDENTTPLESGLEWTVAWIPENRDFIGREALEQQRERGQYPVFVGLVLQGKTLLRPQQTVTLTNGKSGRITSGSFSPTLGVSIGLARIPRSSFKEVTVAIRNKQLTAKIVNPPFVRNGKACIDLTPEQQDEDDYED